MQVKCLYDTGINLSQKFLDRGWTKESKMHLNLNSNVYGIAFFEKDICMYLICDKYNKPFWYPDEIFEIIDNKLSFLWYSKKFKKSEKIYEDWMFFGYYELIHDINHSDNLMEREDKDLEVFYKRKKEMDMEFPDLSIKIIGKTIDSKTLKCPICDNMWESNSIFGMVECPKCNNIMHNPRYEKIIE